MSPNEGDLQALCEFIHSTRLYRIHAVTQSRARPPTHSTTSSASLLSGFYQKKKKKKEKMFFSFGHLDLHLAAGATPTDLGKCEKVPFFVRSNLSPADALFRVRGQFVHLDDERLRGREKQDGRRKYVAEQSARSFLQTHSLFSSHLSVSVRTIASLQRTYRPSFVRQTYPRIANIRPFTHIGCLSILDVSFGEDQNLAPGFSWCRQVLKSAWTSCALAFKRTRRYSLP